MTILLALDKGMVALSGRDWQIRGQTGSAMADTYVDRLIDESALGPRPVGRSTFPFEPNVEVDSTHAASTAATGEDIVALDDDMDDTGDVTDAVEAKPADAPAEVMPEPAPAQPFGFAVRTLGNDWTGWRQCAERRFPALCRAAFRRGDAR